MKQGLTAREGSLIQPGSSTRPVSVTAKRRAGHGGSCSGRATVVRLASWLGRTTWQLHLTHPALRVRGVETMALLDGLNQEQGRASGGDLLRALPGQHPIGAPIVGFVAETFSPRAALLLGATATLAACLYG